MAAKRKLSMTDSDFEAERTRRKHSGEHAAGERIVGGLSKASITTTEGSDPSADVDGGYRPQSPRDLGLEHAIECELHSALERKIHESGRWFPPGLSPSLSEPEKESIRARLTAKYNDTIATHNRRRWFRQLRESSKVHSPAFPANNTQASGKKRAQGEYIGLQDAGMSASLDLASTQYPNEGDGQDDLAAYLIPEQRITSTFETPPPYPTSSAMDLRTVNETEKRRLLSMRLQKPPVGAARVRIGDPTRVANTSNISQSHKGQREDHDRSRSANYSLGEWEIAAGAASRSAESVQRRSERFVSIENPADVRDLLNLVRHELAMMEANPSGYQTGEGRAQGFLRWQLVRLKQQVRVLERITGPEHRPRSNKLPYLLKRRVTEALPFRLPVNVALTHTNGRLSDVDIQSICKTFDIRTYDGMNECIRWLEGQVTDLKTSHLHWQPTTKNGPKQSEFLRRVLDLLSELQKQRTGMHALTNGSKSKHADDHEDGETLSDIPSPSYSPRSVASGSTSSISSPLRDDEDFGYDIPDDVFDSYLAHSEEGVESPLTSGSKDGTQPSRGDISEIANGTPGENKSRKHKSVGKSTQAARNTWRDDNVTAARSEFMIWRMMRFSRILAALGEYDAGENTQISNTHGTAALELERDENVIAIRSEFGIWRMMRFSRILAPMEEFHAGESTQNANTHGNAAPGLGRDEEMQVEEQPKRKDSARDVVEGGCEEEEAGSEDGEILE